MDYAKRVEELEAEGLCTSDAQSAADVEEQKLWEAVRSRIRLTSAYPQLRDAALRFQVSLHGKNTKAAAELKFSHEPELLLSVHAGVMNSKSERCKTLRALADSVIRQAELPMKPRGMYRGMEYVVDVWNCPPQWKER